MNLRKNKTLVTIVVILIAFGLVVAYIPFLFPQSLRAPESDNQFSQSQPQVATLALPLEVAEVVEEIESSTSSEKISPPESFLGLEEESELLGELDSLLKDLDQ